MILAMYSVHDTWRYNAHDTRKYAITRLNFKWAWMSQLDYLFTLCCSINTDVCISNQCQYFHFNLMDLYSDVHIIIHKQHIQYIQSMHTYKSRIHIYHKNAYTTPNTWPNTRMGYTYICAYITRIHHSHSPSSTNEYQTQTHVYHSHSLSSTNRYKLQTHVYHSPSSMNEYTIYNVANNFVNSSFTSPHTISSIKNLLLSNIINNHTHTHHISGSTEVLDLVNHATISHL